MQQRRLAPPCLPAIKLASASAGRFSDIVGYTALMGEDEKKAFEFLRNNCWIHRRYIRKHRGRWLKEMGDGILASFSSIIDAVMYAVSIQKATEELNNPSSRTFNHHWITLK